MRKGARSRRRSITVRSPRLLRRFEQPLLSFFLARDAMPRPGNGFESLGVDFFAARNSLSEAAFATARQRAIDHVVQLAVVVALAEEIFLGIGARGAVRGVLRGFIVGCSPVLLIADHHVAQLVAPRFQPFSIRLEFL